MDGGVPAGTASIEERSSRRVEPEETSAVHVSGHTMGRESDRKVTDLVKRCDQPVQVLIQPESLILAQSERWRQA